MKLRRSEFVGTSKDNTELTSLQLLPPPEEVDQAEDAVEETPQEEATMLNH